MAEIIEELNFRNKVHIFENRSHAGELLAEKLEEFRGEKDAYVFAIPAGGVEVAVEIAGRLNLPLDLSIIRKIHVPWNREAGFGAISWNGVIFLNERLIASLGLTEKDVNRCVAEEKEVIKRRLKKFRGDKPFPDLEDKISIVVDDGLASGFSMLTTAITIKRRGVRRIIVAVPTAPESAINLIRPHVDEIICLNIRTGSFFAVADAYKTWYDSDDDEVIRILKYK